MFVLLLPACRSHIKARTVLHAACGAHDFNFYLYVQVVEFEVRRVLCDVFLARTHRVSHKHLHRLREIE
jgi:hypothetical protein